MKLAREETCRMPEDHGTPRESQGRKRLATRFAAAVLMQTRVFEPLALEWGPDVPRLQQAFRCSYAAVSIRLAEVLRDPPFMVALYGRDRKERVDTPDLRVKVARRTRGFGTPGDLPICGERGGGPHWGSPIPPSSLAEQVARYCTARYTQYGRRLRHPRPARHQDGESGEGDRRRRARRHRRCPPPSDGRIRHVGARAQADGGVRCGWPLVEIEGRAQRSV